MSESSEIPLLRISIIQNQPLHLMCTNITQMFHYKTSSKSTDFETHQTQVHKAKMWILYRQFPAISLTRNTVPTLCNITQSKTNCWSTLSIHHNLYIYHNLRSQPYSDYYRNHKYGDCYMSFYLLLKTTQYLSVSRFPISLPNYHGTAGIMLVHFFRFPCCPVNRDSTEWDILLDFYRFNFELGNSE
jgi:hypothetical protein